MAGDRQGDVMVLSFSNIYDARFYNCWVYFSKKDENVTPFSIKINNLEQDIIVLSDLHGRNQLHYSALPMYMLTLIPRQGMGVEGRVCVVRI